MSEAQDEWAGLSAVKRELLLRRLNVQGKSARPPLVARGSVGTREVLSYSQEWMWVLEQAEPGHLGYIIPLGLRLEGELDVGALGSALGALLARHASLRTRIVAGPEGPMQVVDPPGPLALPVEDVEGRSAAAAAQAREAETPFDLARDPMLRCRLLRLAPTSHLLLLTLHHIAFDDWSVGVLLGELGALYAVETGLAPAASLPPSPAIAYADYAAWQRGWLKGAALERELAFWTRHLAGAPQVLDLPTDRPRPAALDPKAGSQPIELSADLVARLRALCRREGVTLFMAVLAGFHQVLARWSGQRDILIGVPVAGRTEAALEQVVGCFINTVVMRLNLPGRLSLRQALAHVRDAALAAYAHQDTPFARLVEALAPRREPSQTPLVQVGLDLHNTPPPPGRLGPLEAIPVGSGGRGAKLDLFLTLEDTGAALLGSLDYRSALFEPDTMARMAGHLVTVLSAMADAPETPLERLPLLTAAERHDLLIARNATAAPYPHACLSWLIEDQATRTPDAVAVEAPDATLSYAELNRRADRLAWRLSDLGVGPEHRVGLCLERSAAMLVALLAVMKTGGAFVPLDPAFPPERIAFMLEDSTARVLIADASLPPGPLPTGLALLRVDDADDTPVRPLPRRATPDNLCYQIYTSGSTGRPKGVLVSHRALVNYLHWCVRAYGAAAGCGAPVQSSIAADAIFPSLFAPLLVGTRVVMIPESPALEALADSLRSRRGFSLMKITPSQLEVLNEQAAGDDLKGWVGTLVIGAEALRGTIAAPWQDRAPETIVLNEYGPTETVVGCSIYRLPPGRRLGGAVPIGLPIANLEFYVLDRALQPAPVGVPGELYIGGEGLAWGYFGRPGQTAQSFVPHPFARTPGARLYKTGDVVKLLADSEAHIEFLGRRDHQVKLRGYRVELGEIEAVLAAHPAVREVVVVARPDLPGGTQLAAYIVPTVRPAPDPAQWRAYLLQHLPAYMAPSAFVMLDAFPLLAHGKLDRNSLPDPQQQAATQPGPEASPETPLEKTLAKIWADVLKIPNIARHQNFFEIGGDSISAVRIVAAARQAGLKLAVRDIFTHQTVAELAQAASVLAATKASPRSPDSLVQEALSPIQSWFVAQSFAEPGHWNQALAVAAHAPVDPAHLAGALDAVQRRHPTLRSRFDRADDPERSPKSWDRITIEPEPPIALTVQRLAKGAFPQALEVVGRQMQSALDPERGPLWRCALAIEEDGRSWLVIVAHHLVIDAISWGILFADLETAYHQLCRREPVRLPPATSYSAWVNRAADYVRSGALDAECARWAALPCARSGAKTSGGPHDLEADTVVLRVDLPEDLTEQLVHIVPSVYRTRTQEVLLAALAAALTAWSGARQVRIDIETHGREELFDDVDLTRSIGWFTAIYPMIFDSKPEWNAKDALVSVKEAARSVPNNGVGYGLIRTFADPKAESIAIIRSQDAADVVFNYLGRFDRMVGTGDLFEQVEIDLGPSRGAGNRRPYRLEVEARLMGKTLETRFAYGRASDLAASIEALANGYRDRLRDLIVHCATARAGHVTPSDFPEVNLSQEELDSIVENLDENAT